MKWCVSRQNLFSCCGIMQQQVSEPGTFNGWTFRGTEIVQTTLGGTVQWPVCILEPERYLWWSDEQNCLHVHWWCRPSKVHGTSRPRPSNSLPQCKATSTKTEDSWYMGLQLLLAHCSVGWIHISWVIHGCRNDFIGYRGCDADLQGEKSTTTTHMCGGGR